MQDDDEEADHWFKNVGTYIEDFLLSFFSLSLATLNPA